MPTVNGGSVESSNDPKNIATVTTASASNTEDWVLVLNDPPLISNFTKDEKLIYNSKGTNNPNANNYLTVTSVVGPGKYKCSGNYPINI